MHHDASITVTFTPSSGNGGTVITGYTSTCSSGGGATGTTSGSLSPMVVSGLTNGSTYSCTVHGTNAVGNSLESPASASTIPATTPAVPAQPTVTRGDGQISVVFVAPANGGSTITGYTAACSSGDGGTFGSHAGGTSPIVVDALTNAKTYTCTVAATNAEGTSGPSAPSASAVPGLVPSAPAQPTVTHGNASISVGFSAPSSDGGSVIIAYSASCTSSDGGTGGSNTGATSPIVVSTLTNGKTYTCAVFASNVNGPGNASPSSATTVPATTPGAPAQPTVTHGNASISVAFVAPVSDGGSAITGYTAACTPTTTGTPGTSTGATSPVLVSALTNGSAYTCVVHATNAEGSGSDSIGSASTIPATIPSTPTTPTIAPSGTTMTVTFAAPATGGSPITGYTATCTSSDSGITGSNTGASSPFPVPGLTLGKTYTCTVHATNAEGNSAESSPSLGATIPAIVPGAPAQPTVTPGNASISVAFVAPGSDGGSVITGYTATCLASGGGTDGSHSGATSPILVSALTNGSTYTCTVHATNTVGNSVESDASVAAVPSTVPVAPAKPTTAAAATHIAVTFVAPVTGGSAITGYTATCTSTNGGTDGTMSGVSSPISVQLLTKGKSYLCTVYATNAIGNSGASPASNATVVPATVPDAPAQPVTTLGNGQITVTFVVPNDGGSAITGYSTNCTSSDGGVPGSHSGGASPMVVTGLDNGKTYTCTVLATNGVGDSDASIASAATVPGTVPGIPSVPTLTRGNASISVVFTAPGSDGGSAITGYTANCTSSDGGTAGSNSGASSPVLVSLLTNGKTYTCTVLATNAAGSGTASGASASAVPLSVPTAPATPTLTHGNGQISVAFVAPANGGSVITGYTATCTSSDGGATGAHSGATSPNVVLTLTNGKTYTCKVHATNAMGDSLESSASLSTIPATMPSAPAMPTITRGNTQLLVTFVAPANGGSAITGYTATCTSSDGGVTGIALGDSSPLLLRALTNGKLYTCVVLATNAEGGGSTSVVSGSMRPGVAPENSVHPTITGVAINHRTLTGNDGAWRAGPPPTITRQWQRCNIIVTRCDNIPGAVGHTYVMSTADLFHRIRLVVTGTNVLGALSVSSAVTAQVKNG